MEKDKYEILLAELANVLKSKNETIMLQKFEINELKRQIEFAEKSANTEPKIERR